MFIYIPSLCSNTTALAKFHGQADSSDHACHTITYTSHVCTSIYIHSLYRNEIGDVGARCLSAAIENMVNLQVLQ